jgi:hypothetical protein
MTVRNISRTMLLILIALAISLPMDAATRRRRAVTPRPVPRPADVTLTGTVVDAVSGARVVGADVSAVNVDRFTTTDAAGMFTLEIPAGTPVTLRITRSGYDTLETVVAIPSAASQQFQLVSRQTVRVRLTNGQTHELDIETVEFGFVTGPFAGYSKGPRLNLCKPGGSSFTPDRGSIQRITGPATLASHAACCANRQVQSINIVMKSGEATTAYLSESCFDYSVDVIGRDHRTFNPAYFRFADIAEIVFP